MSRNENEKAEKLQWNQERKLKRKVNEIKSELLNQAQSLPDQQLPMDMGEAKQELKAELRECGDQVREGVESACDEKGLQQVGELLMKELQQQKLQDTDQTCAAWLMQIEVQAEQNPARCPPTLNAQSTRDSGVKLQQKSETIWN